MPRTTARFAKSVCTTGSASEPPRPAVSVRAATCGDDRGRHGDLIAACARTRFTAELPVHHPENPHIKIFRSQSKTLSGEQKV